MKGGPVGQAKLKTKPPKPHPFPHRKVDRALMDEWTKAGHLVCYVRGQARRDGSTLYEQAYVTVHMVAMATGRSRRMVDQWAQEGKFIPARKVNGQKVYAVENLDRLLREGDFFRQTIHDRGHIGNLAARTRKGVAQIEEEERSALPGLPASQGQKKKQYA